MRTTPPSIARHDGSSSSSEPASLVGLTPRARRSLSRLFSANALAQLAPRPALFQVAHLPEEQAVMSVQGSAHEELYTQLELPVLGQGTVSFSVASDKPFRIVINEQATASQGRSVLVLEIGPSAACFRQRNDDDALSMLESADLPALVDPHEAHAYWFSVDKKNLRLRFGRGYPQASLCLLECDLSQKTDLASGKKGDFQWLERLHAIAVCGPWTPEELAELQGRIWPQPVTTDLSPLLISNASLTLDDIERNHYTVVEDLSPESQRLYANVSGPGIRLDPEFVEALRHSIQTPGCMCHEMLKHKAESREFGKPNEKETYLRITVGEDQGNSPGVPYVVEIWPAGHYSPIHSHSGSHAIIKVLHGSISANYYRELSPQTTEPYQKVGLQKGDVTWLAPDMYQTHQLHNEGSDVCVTIQCYAYGAEDHRHYEFFDFLDESSHTLRPFRPNTDWPWGVFKQQLLNEWRQRSSCSRQA